jgi:hypothetical protein
MVVPAERSLLPRYAAALVVSLLTVLSLLLNSVLSLTMCKRVLGVSRLSVAPAFKCYTAGQILLWILLAGFLLPSPLIAFFLLRHTVRRDVAAGRTDASEGHFAATAAGAIRRTFTSVYTAQAPWWECVLMFRRIVLVVLSRVAVEPMLKVVLMSLLLALSGIVHVIVQPFRARFDNVLETVALTILMVFTVFTMRNATMISFGQVDLNSEHYSFTSMDVLLTAIVASMTVVMPIVIRYAFIAKGSGGIGQAIRKISKTFGFASDGGDAGTKDANSDASDSLPDPPPREMAHMTQL